MGQKQFFVLILIAVAMGAAYFFADSSETRRAAPGQVRLFDDMTGENIAKVVIEQGKEKLELNSKDGGWVIASRGNYPADPNKIRSLLLKVFDLSVSQRVPVSPGTEGLSQLEKLGLADSSVEKGQSKLSFLDAAGKLLGGLRIGVPLQAKKSTVFSGGGQYIRREGQDAVYAIALPIEATPKLASWLEGDVVAVLQSTLFQVVQGRESAESSGGEFSLAPGSLRDAVLGRAKDIEFQGKVPEGKQLDSSGVNQIAGALESLRASDVWPADHADVKDLKFDFVSTYKTLSGLVYTVRTAQKGDVSYAKIEVKFDPSIVEKVKAEFDAGMQELSKASPTPSPSPQPSPSAVPSPVPSESASPLGTPTTTPTPVPTPEAPKVSSKDEADKLNAKFKPWVYAVPQYQGSALRKTADSLFVVPAKEEANPNLPPGAIPMNIQ